MNTFLSLVVFLFLWAAFYKVYVLVEEIKIRRRESLGDDVEFDDWKLGSPERQIPENAKSTDFR